MKVAKKYSERGGGMGNFGPAGLATGPSGGGGSSGDACSGGVAVTSEKRTVHGAGTDLAVPRSPVGWQWRVGS